MIRKTLILILILGLLSQVSIAQNKGKNSRLNPSELIKMENARHEYLARDYRKALTIYRSIFKEKKNVSILNYRIAECHAKLKRWDLAVEYFSNAVNLDSNVDKNAFMEYGIALLHDNHLNRAMDAFSKFQKLNTKKYVEKSNVDYYIAQVKEAKLLMKHPVNVKITNMGPQINSRFGDYGASLTADGKTIIFTSRRQDTKGGGIDVNGDHKFFEDVYISKWDSAKNQWTQSHPIPGRVNTKGYDACLSISKDGKKLFIYRNDGNLHIGDIFVSNYSDYSHSWAMPRPLNKTINTSYFESSASLTADGNYLYFVSERKGGYGGGDIYVAKRIRNYTYGPAKNLGPVINTKYDEISVFIHPDGKTLFFSSKGHNTMGGYDIFMSRMKPDSTWTTPVNVGYPINTVNDDLHFSMMPNNKVAYYDAVRKGGYGGRDIYKIDMSHYPILKGVETKLAAVGGKISGFDSSKKEIPVVQIINTKTQAIQNVKVDEETGHYYTTLEANKNYEIKVSLKGYKTMEKTFKLKYNADEINTLTLNFNLEKQ